MKTYTAMLNEMFNANYEKAYTLAVAYKYFKFKKGKIAKADIETHIISRLRSGGLGKNIKTVYAEYLKTL